MTPYQLSNGISKFPLSLPLYNKKYGTLELQCLHVLPVLAMILKHFNSFFGCMSFKCRLVFLLVGLLRLFLHPAVEGDVTCTTIGH